MQHPVASSPKETRYKPGRISDDSDDEPLSARTRVKRKRLASHSSDEDDTPLMAKIGTKMNTKVADRADSDKVGVHSGPSTLTDLQGCLEESSETKNRRKT